MYNKRKEQLNGRKARKIGNNTYLQEREGGGIAVRLHATDIITFKPDGSEIYNSGGWRTITTKSRMNEYGTANITQKAGIWYINDLVYRDGCILKAGKITGADRPGKAKTLEKEIKKAKTYCKNYMIKFMAREIPAPSNGDCFGCLMKATDGTTPLGGRGHILDHMRERYYVPSLVVRACEAFGVSPMAKNMFAYAWNPAHKAEAVPDFVKDIAGDQIGKSLYRYIKRELGLAS